MNFKKILSECGVDSFIFLTDGSHVDENFYYFTGLSKTIQVTSTVIITKSGLFVIANKLEADLFRGVGKIIVIETREDAEKAMRKYSGKSVGVDFSSITAKRLIHFRKILKSKNIIDVSEKIEHIRSVKSNSEIKKINIACKITEEILNDINKFVRKSKTEKDLAAELLYAAKQNGAEDASFPSIVAFGKNSAVPHHVPDQTNLSKGVLLVDFGVVYDGYCSDITRMFYLGKADQKTRQIYEDVYSSQKASIGLIRDGARIKDIHIAADRILQEKLKQKLIHSVGHGLGIKVHEYPGVSDKSKGFLKNGMVITIEPGYYKNGWGGIRIEDDVLVGKKAILLSKSPSSITEI